MSVVPPTMIYMIVITNIMYMDMQGTTFRIEMPASNTSFDIRSLSFYLRCGHMVLHITNVEKQTNNMFLQSGTANDILSVVWRQTKSENDTRVFMILRIIPSCIPSNIALLISRSKIEQIIGLCLYTPKFSKIYNVNHPYFVLYSSKYIHDIFSENTPVCVVCKKSCPYNCFSKVLPNMIITPCGCDASRWIAHSKCIEQFIKRRKCMICPVCGHYYRFGNIGNIRWYNRFLENVFGELDPFASSLSRLTSYDPCNWDRGTPEDEKYNRDDVIPTNLYHSFLNMLLPTRTIIKNYMWQKSYQYIWLYDVNKGDCEWCVLLRLIDCQYRAFCVSMVHTINEKKRHIFQKAMSAVMEFANSCCCFIMHIIRKNTHLQRIRWMEDIGMVRHTHPSNAPFTFYKGICAFDSVIMKTHSSYPYYEDMLWGKHARVHSVFTEEEVFNQFVSRKAHS
jgi:hypothetical protein